MRGSSVMLRLLGAWLPSFLALTGQPARAADEAEFFHGRWRGEGAPPILRDLGLEPIEIGPCGIYVCAFAPRPDGSCGSLVVVLVTGQPGYLDGETDPELRHARVQVRRDGDRIAISLSDGTVPFTLRGADCRLLHPGGAGLMSLKVSSPHGDVANPKSPGVLGTARAGRKTMT